MNLNLGLDTLPENTRGTFEVLQAQMAAQWAVGHAPDGRLKRRILKAYHNTTQTLTNGTWTPLNFNAEDDLRGLPTIEVPAGVHSRTTRPDRFYITPALAGQVRIFASAFFTADVDGERGLRLTKNDAVFRNGTIVKAATAAVGTVIQAMFSVRLAAGDSIGIEALQTSGGNLDVGHATLREGMNEVELEFI